MSPSSAFTPQATRVGADGWTSDAQTWVYVSAGSFKVTGVDVSARFPKGTRVRFKQGGGYKYMVVTDVSFSTDTTVTVTAGTDYTVANAAITDNYYSYQVNPQGYPTFFNYTPTFGGFSSAPTSAGGQCIFSVEGGICVYNLHYNSSGTSNSSALTVSLPIPSTSIGGYPVTRAQDNGSFLYAIGEFVGSTLTFYKDGAGTGWTASGSKNVWFLYTYQI